MDKLMRASELVNTLVAVLKAEHQTRAAMRSKAKGVRGDEYKDQGGPGEYDTRGGTNIC